MNALIVYPIIIMLIVGGFSQLMLFSSLDLTSSTPQDFNVNQPEGSQTTNNETTTYSGEATSVAFTMTMATGLIILITALVIVGAVAGIRILGSGLSEYSVKLIHKAVVYYGLWGVFSGIAFFAFASIPLGLGLFAWLGMTVFYTLGFFQSL